MTCRAGVGDGRSPLRSRGWAWAKRETFNIQFKKTRVITQGSKNANVEAFLLFKMQSLLFGNTVFPPEKYRIKKNTVFRATF